MPKHIRPIRVEGQLAYITLTQGYEAVIDAEDINRVNSFNWCAKRTPSGQIYAVTGVNVGKNKGTTIRMHRLILQSPFEVDHKDGNGLNNRRYNLRVATRVQNAANRGLQSNNTSGIKGVQPTKTGKRWRAFIQSHGKQMFLGSFATPELARAAYCEAARKHHGEFARLE